MDFSTFPFGIGVGVALLLLAVLVRCAKHIRFDTGNTIALIVYSQISGNGIVFMWKGLYSAFTDAQVSAEVKAAAFVGAISGVVIICSFFWKYTIQAEKKTE